MTAGWLTIDHDRLLDTLDRTERHLDPANPEAGGHVRVLGYGEMSAALTIDELPGLVCKRMAGYRDGASVSAYRNLVEEYLAELARAGVQAAPTLAVPVRRADRPPVLYLVQPRADATTLGHRLLHDADDEVLASALRQVLDAVAGLARSNAARTDGVEVAMDGQLSNWSFDTGAPGPAEGGGSRVDPQPPGTRPVLLDVGTPFIRRNGRHSLDVEVLVAPAPPGIRAVLRRFVADSYQDDYFVPRTLALDLLGNFHKERAAQRIGLGTDVVNGWLATTDLPGPREPIAVTEVAQYYRQDARLLGLFLQSRRAYRTIRTTVLRRPYDFLLPGHVAR